MACLSNVDDLPKTINCYDCAANLAIPLIVQQCDYADGTVEVTTLGETETIDLQGVSYEDFKLR